MNYVEDIEKYLEKEFGKGICLDASSIIDNPRQVIGISPSLDIGLGGGITEGSVVICSGKQKAGKTTTALWFAANCQKVENGERFVYYLDVEGRLDSRNLKTIPHFRPELFKRIGSMEGKILTAEDYLNLAEKLIHMHPRCVVILDSASAMCSEKEQVSSMTAQTRADGPKLLAQFCRKIAGPVNVNKNIVWITQHMIANTGSHVGGFMEDGGNKIQYACNVKIRAKWAEYVKKTDKSDPHGQIVHWEIVYSAINAPGRKVDGFIRFGHGIDEAAELVEFAVNMGFINQRGSWCTLDYLGGEEPIKCQGKEKTYAYLREHPEDLKKLKDEIYGLLLPEYSRLGGETTQVEPGEKRTRTKKKQESISPEDEGTPEESVSD